MDLGNLLARIKAILTTPQTEWPVIAGEPATVHGLYRNYILIVAALPVIAHFIRHSLIGYGGWGMHLRTPVGIGLLGMVVYYLLSLAVTYLVALLVDAMAPMFGGQKDPVQALKTVAYAWTAGWVGGIAVIIPWLGWLVALASLIYGIYLLYLGLPHTMRCPADKAAGYTAVTVIITIVLIWIVSLIVAALIGTAALTGARMGSMQLGGDSRHAATEASSTTAAQASKALEAVQKPVDNHVQSLPTDTIKTFLPDTLAGMKRQDLSAERNSTVGMQLTSARANYSDDHGHNVRLEVGDTGSMRGMMAAASALAPDSEQQTEHGYEKTYTSQGRLIHEAWNNDTHSGEYGVIVAQRFAVKASGNAESIDQLKQVVNGVDLGKLESLKNAGTTAN
ncbi:YIP1 family protein [Dyella halodurans]|uniref:Yip1 family protein n=1 Tax=Dyella halodurans TaxID=1920171 RepID=A0ABV9BZ90_9GAMM|nr:Yip1 family protein [Dyella halodurans]